MVRHDADVSRCEGGRRPAGAVTGVVARHAAIFDMPDLREQQERTILRVARQVVVLAIDRALRHGDSSVRGAGALAPNPAR